MREPLPSVFGLACVACALACTPEPEISTARLVLGQVQSCALGETQRLTISALGDFAPERMTLKTSSVLALDVFPTNTRELELQATLGAGKRAWGVALLDADDAFAQAQRVWVLPELRSCPLGDPFALALPGAAVAALPEGGLLIAGGLDDDGLAVSSALVLAPGAELVEQVPEGMLLRRAQASATLAGDVIVVAGGAADSAGSAHDTYELYMQRSRVFERERSQKLLTGPRMQHGAALLADGRVLLVGGRAQATGDALATAELIDPAGSQQRAVTGADGLQVARIAPSVLALDSGAVLVIGGHETTTGSAVRVVERFDPRARRFGTLTPALPERAVLVAVAVPGGRAAWVACDAAACELGLLLPRSDDDDFMREDLEVDFASQLPGGLLDLRLLALADGRLLLTGRDPAAAIARRAFVIDLNRATLEKRDASRVPTVVAAMRDGTIAELDAFGASLRREPPRSAYAAPSGNLLGEQLSFIALDAPSHWQRAKAALTATQAGARMDLAGLRFADVRIEVDAVGAVELLLHAQDGSVLSITRDAGALAADGCKSQLPMASALVITRAGGSVQLGTKEVPSSCKLALPVGPVSIAVQAAAGTELTELTVTRL